MAIRMGELPDFQLIGRKLTSLHHGLYAAPGCLANVGAVKGPADLSRCECLRMQGPIEGKARLTLVRGDRVEKVSIKGRFVANSMRFLRQLATMGLGIAVIDDAIARPAVAAGSLVRVLPEWSLPPVPVYALTPSKLMPARTRIFLEILSDHLRGEGR